jgi:hypothetical protein
MALVKIEGREISLDDTIAGNDDLLKQALLPHLAEVANATISREQKDGQMVVTLVKRAGPKGMHSVLAALYQVPEEVNPVFGLAWMIQWNEARHTMEFTHLMDLQPAIESAIKCGEGEEQHTSRALTHLKAATPIASRQLMIVGF